MEEWTKRLPEYEVVSESKYRKYRGRRGRAQDSIDKGWMMIWFNENHPYGDPGPAVYIPSDELRRVGHGHE